MSGYTDETASGGGSAAYPAEGRERGARRRKIAGYLRAANELRQSYQQQYREQWGATRAGSEWEDDTVGIPGAFPEASIIRHGVEELMLFPSYCKRHTKEQPDPSRQNGGENDPPRGSEEFWKAKWEEHQSDNAVVDVDVRGWLYSPHKGPLNRKNRLMIGLARQLSGLPAPKFDKPGEEAMEHHHLTHEERQALRDEERIAREAENIMRKGWSEEAVATKGGYSERPRNSSDNEMADHDRPNRSGTNSPPIESEDGGPIRRNSKPLPRKQTSISSTMSSEELAAANSNLMARLRPFLTIPLAQTPITIFFYNDATSKSRTTMTNEAGHFNIRAPLDFVPTHVRVIASEHLTTIQEVKIIETKGVSLISDIDDTIKHSSIAAGAREIFRNTFIRDLGELTVEGVREWYNTLHDMGVGVHYVSNSPWQLYPVLASYFKLAGLPPGSFHLKQYSGMLQGIFEPVAERKKGTLDRIMRDFPDRKFILVGDSGEADLEVYTDVVLANPGRIIAVFIRDVTTPPKQGFFDSAMGPLNGDRSPGDRSPYRVTFTDTRVSRTPDLSDERNQRPPLPSRVATEATAQQSSGPRMGTLIDFEDDAPATIHQPHREVLARSASDRAIGDAYRRSPGAEKDLLGGPPIRPSKPLSLRGAAMDDSKKAEGGKSAPRPPPKPRELSGSGQPKEAAAQANNQGYVNAARQRITTAYNAIPPVSSVFPKSVTQTSLPPLPPRNNSAKPGEAKRSDPPPPPPPRRIQSGKVTQPPIASSLSMDSTTRAPPSNDIGTKTGSGAAFGSYWTTSPVTSDDEDAGPGHATTAPTQPLNKKVELWQRRWKRAKDILDAQGVALRSWRVGSDVVLDAVQLTERALRDMGVKTGIQQQEKK